MENHMSRKLTLGSFLVLAATASCGGSDAPKAETPPKETAAPPPVATGSCAFLTAADIQEVLGRAVGEAQPLQGTEVCSWPSADNPSSVLVRVTYSDSGYPTYEAFVASYQAEFGGEEPPKQYFRPIQGVGDWAMFVADQNAVQVFRGGKMLQVGTDPPDEQKSVALAQKALPRLP